MYVSILILLWCGVERILYLILVILWWYQNAAIPIIFWIHVFV